MQKTSVVIDYFVLFIQLLGDRLFIKLAYGADVKGKVKYFGSSWTASSSHAQLCVTIGAAMLEGFMQQNVYFIYSTAFHMGKYLYSDAHLDADQIHIHVVPIPEDEFKHGFSDLD